MDSEYLEKAWAELLSRRPARIKRMFISLDTASQQEVIKHLRSMAAGDGWQEPQIISAKAALSTLETLDHQTHE
jgi:hypothetical protein